MKLTWWRQRSPKRSLPQARRFRPWLEGLEDRALPSNTTWTGLGPNNNWSTAANWSSGVPGTGDTAIFTSHPGGSSTAVVDAAFSVFLSMDGNWGGTIQVNNPLTTTGSGQWVSGTINVADGVSWTNSGTLNITGTNDLFLSGTLNNSGTVTQAAPSSFNRLNFTNNAVLNNTGLYDIQENGEAMRLFGGSTLARAFNNANTGILRKSGPATVGTATLGSVPFNNAATGTVDVRSGTLSLSGGGTDAGGTFTFQNGGVLDLTGGSSPTLTGSYTGSGAGTVSLANGALVIGASGATFNFPAGLFQWTGGNIDARAGALTNQANTGFITISGSNDVFLLGTLNNAGTITQANPPSSFNRLNFSDSAVLNNTGLYDIQENNEAMRLFGGSGPARSFNNFGTLQKSGPATAGTTTLGTVPFNNDAAGLVNVTVAGTLSLSGGGADAGGTFTFQNGGVLDLTGGSTTATLTGTYTGSGSGTVSLASGTLNVGTGGATFNFPSGLFQWTGGNIDARTDILTNAATGFLALNASAELFLLGTLNNAGTITQTAAGSRLNFADSAVLNNTGLYDIQEDGQVMRLFGGSTLARAFNNLSGGILQKSAGTGTTTVGDVPFNNPGTVGALSGTLSIGVVTGQITGNALTGGTWSVFDTATLTLNGGVALTTNNGNITLSGASPVFTNITNLAVNDVSGTLSLLNGANFTTTGNFSNAGTLVIGPASTFTVTGNYTQAFSGTLDVQLGDVPASGQFGRLVVTGQANLDGTLQIDLVNGYTPNSGDSFTIVTYGSRNGDFATLNIPAGGVWDPNAGTVTFP
jgi:hypothetical protein